MTSTISINELPSVKFEKEIKDLMNYTKLEKYDRGKTESDEIDRWIEAFQLKVEAYLKDSSNNLSLNNDKHCKHFNYLISTMINKVNSLSSKLGKKLEWSSKIKESRDKFFLSNNYIKCKDSRAYVNSDYKDLGTFCYDSAFIKGRMNEIENSVHCQNIVNNMSTRKNILINVRDQRGMRAGRILEIDNECSIQFLDNILPSINCNSSVKHSSQSVAHSPSDNHAGGEKLKEVLMTQQAPDNEGLTTNRQELVTTSGQSEHSDGQSSNTFNLVTLPIIGVLGCSFIFYKFTPVGSIFRSRIQNKGIIPINKDDYSTKQILSNTPNNNDIYCENTQYKISYQTL
ncbi:unnamed protein product [Plasmodium vivax]|uniref:(malaria parasite P. vivax) hypothetical protein n=1 Tax=Plasmodium vivax TaxID=5855 RepID=A0A8S4HH56_PLAVI|nr:unnamed protein product [Plasmodium vivax]